MFSPFIAFRFLLNSNLYLLCPSSGLFGRIETVLSASLYTASIETSSSFSPSLVSLIFWLVTVAESSATLNVTLTFVILFLILSILPVAPLISQYDTSSAIISGLSGTGVDIIFTIDSVSFTPSILFISVPNVSLYSVFGFNSLSGVIVTVLPSFMS